MKRFVLIFACILFLFAGCSDSGNTDSTSKKDALAPNYVAEGQMTVLRSLINSNALFVEEVFVEEFLPVDADKSISDKSGTFAPVSSDIFDSYEDFVQSLNATYTDEAAKSILEEFDMYKDIYGQLYLNTKSSAVKAKNYDWSTPEIEVITAAEGTYELEVTVKTEKGKDHTFEIKAVTVDGNIRLENIYY
ncbi:MAG: hypothetical protein IJO03_09730 [Clostridia bacterium]|nr:hypothetical protein [Clostridia bacterium]